MLFEEDEKTLINSAKQKTNFLLANIHYFLLFYWFHSNANSAVA
jgi:hypothetical protein